VRAVRDFLLAPPGAASLEAPGAGVVRPAERSAAADVPGALAVLCAAEDARAAGVALASLLARRARAACGLACVWTAPEPARLGPANGPSARAARRLAAALDGRGLAAEACGRAAVVALDADPAAAVAAAARAGAAAGDAPAVLVVGGPRPAAFDVLLAEQDRLLVLTRPGADDALGALAVAGLPDAGPAGAVCAVALGPAARALASAGVAVPAPLRRALEAAG
jgi:colicin import membrane protein